MIIVHAFFPFVNYVLHFIHVSHSVNLCSCYVYPRLQFDVFLVVVVLAHSPASLCIVSYGLVLQTRSCTAHSLGLVCQAMAPKGASKAAGSLAPLVVSKDFRIPVQDVSTEGDSGWRSLDTDRVAELKTTFLSGDWGNNIMTKPAVLNEHGNPKLAQNGLRMLCDGKHTFAALKLCKEIYEKAGEDADADESIVWSAGLIDVFTNGVSVNVYEFNDASKMRAWCVIAHDADSNKYKPTSILDLWKLAHEYRQTVPGGEWKRTQEVLNGIYGQKKTMFVYRMMQVAMTLPEEICKKAGELGIPNSYVHENNYFLGHGAEAGKRLGTDYRLKALTMLADDRSLQRGLSPKVFQEEYCAPLHKAEKWIAQQKKIFGTHADIPAFKRVEEFLCTSRARLSILACVRGNTPLHGTSSEQRGIEQCHVIVKEMEASLQRKDDGLGAAAKGAAAGGDGLAAAGGNGLDAAGGNGGAAAGSGGGAGDSMMAQLDEEVDPISVVVQQKVEASMMKISSYQTYDDLERCLAGVVLSSHKVIYLIDAPTSKARVVMSMIDWVVKLLAKLPCTPNSRILVPVGSRVDLLSAVDVRMTTNITDMVHFSIQLNGGEDQRVRKKAAYCQYACSSKLLVEGKVPCSIPAQLARAQKGECTRLRCLDSQCPLRTQQENAALKQFGEPSAVPNNSEIDADDREVENVDDQMQEETGTSTENDTALEELVPPGSRRDCIVDLWPFAFGKEYYKALLDGIAPNDSVDHLVVLSTSAHPSVLLAGHDRRMNVHVLLDRVKQHSIRHGEKILRNWLTRFHDEVERKKVDPASKRLRSEDLFFVKVKAPAVQPVHFIDVPSDEQKSAWRAGMDSIPDPQVLEKGILDLVAKELTDNHLTVTMRKGQHVLVTTRALKEGATICSVSALLFSKESLVRDFLNVGFHAALTESPLLTVHGLDTVAGQGSMSVHAVLVGAARLVTDFRGFRKWANCSFHVSPDAGANDDFISLVVQTHNGCGVAAGSELMADLGEGFVPGAAGDRPPSKKFKGALDALFDEQRKASGDAYDMTEASPSKGRPASGGNGLDAAKGAGSAASAAEASGSGSATIAAAAGAGTGAATASTTAAAAAGAATGVGGAMASAAAEGAATAGGAAATAGGAAAAGGGESVLGTHEGVNVVFKDNQVKLRNTNKKNVKIPPHTVLMILSEGRLTEAQASREHDIPWAPTTPKMQVFLKAGNKHTYMSLAEVIKQHGATQMYQHQGWPKSTPPTSFVAKKNAVMAPAQETVGKALAQAIKASSRVQWTWVVEVQSGKIMPVAAAVSNKKQVCMKANAEEAF